jgi:hypothetical protein
LNSYKTPFWDFNNGGKKKRKQEKGEKVSKIVATFVYASSQGQCTDSAQTNIKNSGHLCLCQQPRGSARTPLGPKYQK